MSTILNTLSEHKGWVQVFFREITTCVFWKRFRTKLLWANWTLINDAIIISSKWNLGYDHRNDWKTLVDILNALGNRVTINHILVDRYHIANIKNESLMIVWLIRQIAVRRLKTGRIECVWYIMNLGKRCQMIIWSLQPPSIVLRSEHLKLRVP